MDIGTIGIDNPDNLGKDLMLFAPGIIILEATRTSTFPPHFNLVALSPYEFKEQMVLTG